MSSALVECFRLTVRRLNTRVKIVRLATSAHVPDTEFTVLPVMAIRFGRRKQRRAGWTSLPPADSGAASGVGGGSQGARPRPRGVVRRRRLPSTRQNRQPWIRAVVPPPNQGGFVSLRASTTDSAGNSVRQTILDAYRLRP
jgi:hypothetical protein